MDTKESEESGLSNSLKSIPVFDEYCISEGKYLPSHRDRAPCKACPLYSLCQAGFEEQVRRAQHGIETSLTDGVEFDDRDLCVSQLFKNLTAEQKEFVLSKISDVQLH